MALSQEQMKNTVDGILKMLDLLDSGKATAGELRSRAYGLPNGEGDGLLAWIDLAESIHLERGANVESPKATNPHFRKGTAMKPVAWSDCLWQPPK